VQRYGEKKLPKPDGAATSVELLQFFIGARIVGIEYPTRWAGKWATGWHDGVWGVFPVKSIEVERPRRGEVPPLLQSGGSSSVLDVSMGGRHASVASTGSGNGGTVTLVTRWKWDPKDAAEKGWLAFDKGDTITNVGWLYRDAWCWSGMNSKGKFGVFPKSHVKMESLKEEVVPLGRTATKSSSRPSRPKLFGLSRRASTGGASSISSTSDVVEIIS
jgi:hypothetical protein